MAYHIIGDADTVLGYRFAGATGDVVENASEARSAFRRAIADHRRDILLLTEAVEDMIQEDVDAHRQEGRPPYLSVVQDIWGPRGNRESLEDIIASAIGIHKSGVKNGSPEDNAGNA